MKFRIFGDSTSSRVKLIYKIKATFIAHKITTTYYYKYYTELFHWPVKTSEKIVVSQQVSHIKHNKSLVEHV